MSTTIEQTTTTVVQIDPQQVRIGANVRLDATPPRDFVANIKERGVIVPVVGYFDAEDGAYVVVDGQKRTLAAIAAGLATIPAYAAHRREDADRIIDQMSANFHRSDISAAERAKAFEQLAGFGLSAAQIVKRTGIKRAEVDAGLTVAKSELATKAADRWDFLTLEHAAALAEFEADPEAVQALTVAAQQGGFDHALQRLRDARDERQALAAFTENLAAGGVTVIERPARTDAHTRELYRLVDGEGDEITAETHAGCPGHAAYVAREWEWNDTDEDTDDDEEEESGGYVTQAVYVCTDFGAHHHQDRWARYDSTGQRPKAAEMSDEEREAARVARRDVIESNKAWLSAETVRREWVTKFLTRRAAPKGSAVFVAATIAEQASALGDYRTPGHIDTLLNGGKHQTRETRAEAVSTVTDGRALMIAVGHCCAAYEAQMGTQTWRSVQTGPARYLAFLAANGYDLAQVEKRAAGLDKPVRKSRAKKVDPATVEPTEPQESTTEPPA